MKRYTHYLIILVCVFNVIIKAQDNFVLASISKSSLNNVKLKWYSTQFLYTEGVVIYKKETTTSNWILLTKAPIKKADYKPNTADFKKDKELQNYIDLVKSSSTLEGINKLAVYIKSFKSDAFSQFLGIEYIDENTAPLIDVQYKVCALQNGTETEIGVSPIIKTGIATIVNSPKDIIIKGKNKSAVINWLPETNRYYAVDIYSMMDSLASNRKKVNKDPIIISKIKNEKGIEEYPKQFYTDENLREDTTYYYSLKAIDFFGEESEFSIPKRVFIKDVNAPEPPVFINKNVIKKTVTVTWKKINFEKDFIGYKIYRAHHSEKNYTAITKTILSKQDTTYTDAVDKYALYKYMIAAIDKSGNEATTLEIPIETVDEEPPAIPKQLSIKSDTGKIELSWAKNTEPDLMGYMVYQAINKNIRNNAYVLITPQPITKTVFNQNLPINSKNKFLYKVLAIDSAYNKSELSDFALTTLPDVVAPTAPFIHSYSVDKKNNSVIEFFKNPELDLKGYNLYRTYTEDDKQKTEQVNDELITRNTTQYTDLTYENTGTVNYYLIAIDSTNNISQKSNTVKLIIKKQEDITINEFKKLTITPVKKTNTFTCKWNMVKKEDDVFYVVYTKKEGDTNFEPQSKNITECKFILESKYKTKTYVQIRAYTKKGLICKSDIKLIE